MATKNKSGKPKVGAATEDKDKTEAAGSASPPVPKTEVAPYSDTGDATSQPSPSEAATSFAGGDVDIANVKPGRGKNEVGPVIIAGFWVRLGEFDGVEDRFVGHVATVERSPWSPAPIGVPHSGIAGYTYDDENSLFVVKTRDSVGALIEVPQEAFTEWGQARVDLESHG